MTSISDASSSREICMVRSTGIDCVFACKENERWILCMKEKYGMQENSALSCIKREEEKGAKEMIV
jgi:hypothetical protein